MTNHWARQQTAKVLITKKFEKKCVVTIHFYGVIGIFQVNSCHVTVWLNQG